jgi:hypothetical protein
MKFVCGIILLGGAMASESYGDNGYTNHLRDSGTGWSTPTTFGYETPTTVAPTVPDGVDPFWSTCSDIECMPVGATAPTEASPLHVHYKTGLETMGAYHKCKHTGTVCSCRCTHW